MKTINIAIACLALCVAGCSSLTQDNCEKAAKTYRQYLKILEEGGIVTGSDIEKATLAADFLQASCGWFPVAKHSALAIRDGNGVLLIREPK
jgi:hypothetical protein